jgi:hypothetical protein
MITIVLDDNGTAKSVEFNGAAAKQMNLPPPKDLGKFAGAKAFQLFAFNNANSFNWVFINGQWFGRP